MPIDFAKDRADQAFHEPAYLHFVEKRRLDVDLRELRLTVGAQVFVAKTLHDLIVAIEARHHQHLLEQLRRLRQCVELAVMDAGGHQELPRAFRRRFVQDRRLDIDEAVLIEIAPR